MFTLILILIFLDCVLLSIVVLIQESKGGGLASGFSSANQMMGVRRTADWLEKATWSLAIALFVLSMAAAAVQGGQTAAEIEQSEVQDFIEGEPVNAPSGFEAPQE